MIQLVALLLMLASPGGPCDDTIHVPSWAYRGDWYGVNLFPITGDFVGIVDLNFLPALRSVEGSEWTVLQAGFVNTNCRLWALGRFGVVNMSRGNSWVGMEVGVINLASENSHHRTLARVGLLNWGPSTSLLSAAFFNVHTKGTRKSLVELGFGNGADDDTLALVQIGHLNWQQTGTSTVGLQVSPLIPAMVGALLYYWGTEGGGISPGAATGITVFLDFMGSTGAMLLTSLRKPPQALGVMGANFVYSGNHGLVQLAPVNVSGKYEHLVQLGLVNVGTRGRHPGGDLDSWLLQVSPSVNLARSTGTTIQVGTTNYFFGANFVLQVGGYLNLIDHDSFGHGGAYEVRGAQVGLINYANHRLRGMQFGAVNVMNGTLYGVQIGALNYASSLRGIQLGLLNIAMHHSLYHAMPILNAGW